MRLPRLIRKFFRQSGPARPKKPAKILGCPADEKGYPLGATFHNIVVVPGVRDATDVNLINGGPIWPDFERQTWPRHMRGKRPVDFCPPTPASVSETIDTPCVWGGMVHFHFGHLCAELLTRILWSLHRWPDATYIFATPDIRYADNVPDYFWAILAWLGLPRHQVRFILQPVCVSELHVMPQAERVRARIATPRSYIDLLNIKTAEILPHAVRSGILYVSRSGMLEKVAGLHAGERYLEAVLRRKGVEIMHPEKLSLEEQLLRYAGATCIIFTEGSAIHGRQLLGRIDQEIIILNRRPGNRRVIRQLQARAKNVRFIEAARNIAMAKAVPGKGSYHLALSFLDIPCLTDFFSDIGINISDGWEEAAYQASKRQDAEIWLRNIEASPNFLFEETQQYLFPVFSEENIADLLTMHPEAWPENATMSKPP